VLKCATMRVFRHLAPAPFRKCKPTAHAAGLFFRRSVHAVSSLTFSVLRVSILPSFRIQCCRDRCSFSHHGDECVEASGWGQAQHDIDAVCVGTDENALPVSQNSFQNGASGLGGGRGSQLFESLAKDDGLLQTCLMAQAGVIGNRGLNPGRMHAGDVDVGAL